MTATLVLGAGYGLCPMVRLREVEQIAAPGELGAAIALSYSPRLLRVGSAVPAGSDSPHHRLPQAVLFTAAAAALTLAAVCLTGRRSHRPVPI